MTAKHVLRQSGTGPFYSSVLLRLNKQDGTSGFVRLRVSGESDPERRMFFHNDPAVDLAVIPVSIDQNTFDYKIVTRDDLMSKDEFTQLHLVEGTEIFFTSLVTPFAGEPRSFPVVRFGRISLVTASFGGTSGSPVFFYRGSLEPNATPTSDWPAS